MRSHERMWEVGVRQIQSKNFRLSTVRGWGQGGEMTQDLYAHMNNKIK
jgi:hypothetical protein